MEPRKLTKEDIDKLRGIEGFPIGTDEDIIALSDAPYYTACPNPFIEEFVRKNGTLYDEATDDYQREPFAADVSEGKTDPIYMAHSYHTKVPHKAIMQYILHYTKPGDIVMDGFCGTGMTGVAAQMCATPSSGFQLQIDQEPTSEQWGARKAILIDLSPAATFIAANYNKKIDASDFLRAVTEILDSVEEETKWMHETIIPSSHGAKAKINYTLWSDVFICPNCGNELVFWDIALDESRNMRKTMHCSNCGVLVQKSKCERAKDFYVDSATGEPKAFAKQVPVLINYFHNNRKREKTPDAEDYELISRINNSSKGSYWYPKDSVPMGVKTAEPIKLGITNVSLFYTSRNLQVLAAIWEKAKHTKYVNQIRFCLTSVLIKTASKLHNVGMKNGKINLAGAMPNALFVPSILAERNIIELVRGKVSDIMPVFTFEKKTSNCIVSCGSSTNLTMVPNDSVDYIFVDPPFGDNLMYSELSFIWEAWLKVLTNNGPEAIMSEYQKKGISEYQELFTKCFSEFYRCLKPNRWITIEFHNSKNRVWSAINEAIQRAGFVISSVKTLDKGQGSYNQQTALGAVKQDLAITAYKPKSSFTRDFILQAGSEEAVWSFIRQYLAKLSVTVVNDGKLAVIAERQAYLLWDRMVAYHIMQGVSVPLDATDFYRGLDERFLKRDNMYFLPDQINEYDMVRSTCEVETIQFSLFVSDEKSAISWLYQQLDEQSGDGPQTYQDLMPKFMQELKAVDKREKMPELSVILEENFLKEDDGKWYIPDLTKSGDIARLREKNLLKEFQEYLSSKGKLKVFRSEAIRAGFAKLWKDKDYAAIVSVAERLPDVTIQEDPNLLMYYDISLGRV